MNSSNTGLSPANSSPTTISTAKSTSITSVNHNMATVDAEEEDQIFQQRDGQHRNGNKEMNLAELLVLRAAPFNERELWAVCRQAAIGIATQLQNDSTESAVHISNNKVCIVSPTSMMFSNSGEVTLTPTVVDEDLEQYFPPELNPEESEISELFKQCRQPSALVFSLAATLFMAADYNLPDEEEPAITEEMELLLSSMTDEDVIDRASLDETAELAADGLMVCEDNEDSDLSKYICENMFDAADSIRTSKSIRKAASHYIAPPQPVKGGRSLQEELLEQLNSGAKLRKVAEEDLKRPSLVQFTERDNLMALIRTPRTLNEATSRDLKPLQSVHIARIAPAPTYVTPHEALLAEIALAKTRLKFTKPHTSPTKSSAMTSASSPLLTASGTPSTSSATPQLLKLTDSTTRPPKTPLGAGAMSGSKKILLTPTIDIMADWDPNKQVQLGFAAESATKNPNHGRNQNPNNGAQAKGVEPTARRLISLSIMPEMDLLAQSSSRRSSGIQPNDANRNNSPAPPLVTNTEKWKRKRSTLRLNRRSSSSNGRKSSQSSMTSLNSADGNAGPPPSPPRTIDITDWGHIRASLVKAKMFNMSDENPELHTSVMSHRACGMCYTKFGMFKGTRHCVICKLVVCATCCPDFKWPVHLHKQLEAMKNPKAKVTAICNDCKLCLGGRSPTRPMKQITTPIVV